MPRDPKAALEESPTLARLERLFILCPTVQFFCGEAGISRAFYELGWRCNINDTCEKLSPVFDDHTFPQDEVHFWKQPFRSIPVEELLADEQRRSVFDWFGN